MLDTNINYNNQKYLILSDKLNELLKQKENILVAIEGGSASGKTTLCEFLEQKYDLTLIHMDDFFLPPSLRTPQRFNEIGGNIDYDRFLNDILLPLSTGLDINYRKFYCSTMTLGSSNIIKTKKLVIVEGVYSMHPKFKNFYVLKVFLEVSPATQISRIRARNNEFFANRYINEWIPMENRYFESLNIKEKCDLIIINE